MAVVLDHGGDILLAGLPLLLRAARDERGSRPADPFQAVSAIGRVCPHGSGTVDDEDEVELVTRRGIAEQLVASAQRLDALHDGRHGLELVEEAPRERRADARHQREDVAVGKGFHEALRCCCRWFALHARGVVIAHAGLGHEAVLRPVAENQHEAGRRGAAFDGAEERVEAPAHAAEHIFGDVAAAAAHHVAAREERFDRVGVDMGAVASVEVQLRPVLLANVAEAADAEAHRVLREKFVIF
mmetsp:Transcript_38643/g.119446  ORF Transcript_38643/g.119446 Transcript_38643/m.119446 type:complete len:243 (-) Transcript_38643:375-1103(-)